jgi:hypothetical protein
MVRESLDKVIFQNFNDPPWPLFVKPFNDESFSSWLLRLSRNHLLRFYSFCSTYFIGVECWNRDLDKFLPEEIKKVILKKTILQDFEVSNMLLSSYYSKVYITELMDRSFWFTPISIYQNSRSHKTSLSICPNCLSTDGDSPYFRKQWRLSFYTVCDTCGKDLIDCCPNCDSTINYLIIEKGRKGQIPIFPITCCWKCFFDLRDSPTVSSSNDQLQMQRTLKEAVDQGYDLSHNVQYSHLYFLVLKKMISLLNKKNIPQLIKLQEEICKQTDLVFIDPKNGRSFPFELMSVEERRNLTYKAYWLLNDWPNRFRETTSKVGLRSKNFHDDFPEIPYWLSTELINNRLVYSEWRRFYPEYAYGSFKELSYWKISKMNNGQS